MFWIFSHFWLAGVLENMEIVTEMNAATTERTKPLRHQSASKPIRKPVENDFEDEEQKAEDESEEDEIEEGITEGKNSVRNFIFGTKFFWKKIEIKCQ